MKWKSLEQDFERSPNSDVLRSLLSTGEEKKTIHFSPNDPRYQRLELEMYGGQSATICPQRHPLFPFPATEEDDDAKQPPTACSVCAKKYVAPKEKTERKESASSSLAVAVPPPPPPPGLRRQPEAREEKEEEEVVVVVEEEEEEPYEKWQSCHDRECGFYTCESCHTAAQANGTFPFKIHAPICVNHHPLSSPSMLPNGLESTCQSCVKTMFAEMAYECEVCSTSANVHYYCVHCVEAAKVKGTIFNRDGSESRITGVISKTSDSLYIASPQGLKMHVYAIQSAEGEEEELFACAFQPDEVEIHRVSKVMQGAEILLERQKLALGKARSPNPNVRNDKNEAKESNAHVFHACSVCEQFRKDLSIENALDVLLASIRDKAHELEAVAEQFIVDNYVALSEHHTGKTHVLAQIIHANLAVATRVTDRLLRLPVAKRVFLRDVEAYLVSLVEDLEQRPSTTGLCAMAEMCGMAMSSLRFEMLWMNLDDKVTRMVTSTLLDTINMPLAKEDTVFASLAASIVGSMANQLLHGNQNAAWPRFIEKVITPLLDGSLSGTGEAEIRLACLGYVSRSAFANGSDLRERLENMYLDEIGKDSGNLAVKARAMVVVHERMKASELGEEFVDEVVSAVCHALTGSNEERLQMEAMKLLYTFINMQLESSAREAQLSTATKDRVFDAVIEVIKSVTASQTVRKEAVAFWNGLGDHDQIRGFFVHATAERSKVGVLSSVSNIHTFQIT